MLRKEKETLKKEVYVRGEGLHFYRFQMFHATHLGRGHYIKTNTPNLIYPSCLLHNLVITLQPQAHHSLHCLAQSSVLWRGEAGFLLAKAGTWRYVGISVPWEHAVTHAHPRFLRAGEGVSCPAAEGQTLVQSGRYLVSED